MARVSSISVEARRMGYFISNLWNVFTLIENRDETILFLKELLTPTEIRMLAKRIQIAKMLIEGYKYDEIKTHIRVTDSTISSVNNQLQFRDGGYMKIMSRLIKIESDREKKKESPRSIFDPGPYAGRKTTEFIISKIAEKGKNYIKTKSVKKSLDK